MRQAFASWLVLMLLVAFGWRVASWEPHGWWDWPLIVGGWLLVAGLVFWLLLVLWALIFLPAGPR